MFMSLDFYLYRAPDDAGPINTWTQQLADALGSPEVVRAQMERLFPGITWDTADPQQTGVLLPHLFVMLYAPFDDSQVYYIVMNRARPSDMRKVAEYLNLNHVSCPETGDLVDIYAYTDHDRFFAKK